MKRDLSVITDEVRDCLRTWLAILDNRYQECPFEELPPKPDPCQKICQAVFPTLKPLPLDYLNSFPCPCDVLGKKYIIKVAKEIIK